MQQNLNVIAKIEMLGLNWSEPTRQGAKFIRTATATPAWWTLWRQAKNNASLMSEIKAAGFGCKPTGSDWSVTRITDSAEPTAAVSYPTLVEEPLATKPVARISTPVTDTATTLVAAALNASWKWSDEQEAIFEWFRSSMVNGSVVRNLVVRARAGTGKTTTIKHAFALAPEKTKCYCVFGKRNQEEALAKITDPTVDVRTLNSLGNGFVTENWAGAKPDQSDAVEIDRLLAILPEAPVPVCRAVARLVGFAKNMFIDPSLDQLIDLADEKSIEAPEFESDGYTQAKLAGLALAVMNASLQPRGDKRFGFNDQVWLPVRKGWVRPRYNLVAVDETQDMNMLQLTMVMSLVTADGRIVVVGDDRQAIYGFRGAATDGLDLMKTRLNAGEIGLTVTRRCPKSTVAIVVNDVPDYKAADDAPEGQGLSLNTAVAMSQLQAGDAVLSRINAPLMSLCLQTLKRGIPARIQGRDIGKSLLGMVRSLKARSVPHFIQRAEAWADKQIARAKASKYADAKIEAINDQLEMLVAVAEGAASVTEIENRIQALFSDESDRPCVVFSSVHRAKGLEWDRVFVLRNTFSRPRPKGAKPPTPAEIQEEKNLWYVAVTRNKNILALCA